LKKAMKATPSKPTFTNRLALPHQAVRQIYQIQIFGVTKVSAQSLQG